MKKYLIISSVFLLIAGSVSAAQPISAPSDLSAIAVSSSQINLNWQDNSSNENGFSIERSTNGVNFSEITEVGSGVTSYSDTGLSENTTYYYRVRAFYVKKGAYNYSSYSNVDSDTTFDTIPLDPSNLSATAASTTINLAWADNSYNEDGFKIERSTNGVDFNQIDLVGEDIYYYTDSDLEESATYYYRVRAYNTAGNSGYSNIDSATTYGAPEAPSNLSGEVYSASSTYFVYLDWQDNSDNETGFEIERSTDGENFSYYDSIGLNYSFYYDWGVSYGNIYYYRVKAVNGWGSSSYSNVEMVEIP